MTDILTSPVQESIFNNGEDYFDALLKDIRRAKSCIDLETYIFDNDPLGQRIAQALSAAAQRGVKVRVLVDGAGTRHWGADLGKSLEQNGVETRVFHPFPWHLWSLSRSFISTPSLLKWIYLLLKMNSRNHRKVCLIDKNIAYVGSINITQKHLKSAAGGSSWRDTAVRLSHEDFNQLADAFVIAWHHQPFKERIQEAFRIIRRNPLIRLNYSRHRRRVLYKNLIRILSKCKTRIWITNAYFVPDNVLLTHLRDAANTGVDVRILLPKTSDVWMMTWASATFYQNLLNAGVRIFEYLPSFLHAKTLIADDWVLVGSSNLNHRSLLHDLEVDINITTPDAKKQVEHQFLEDLKNSKEITLKEWGKRPLWRRIVGRLTLYLKYWI